MNILFKNSSDIVIEDGFKIIFKQNNKFQFLIGIGGVVLGLVFYTISFIPLESILGASSAKATAKFAIWGSFLLVGFSILNIIIAIVKYFNKSLVFDLKTNSISKINLSFNEISEIVVEKVLFSNRVYYRLKIVSDSKKEYFLTRMIPENELKSLLDVKKVLVKKVLSENSLIVGGIQEERIDEYKTENRFLSIFYLIFGLSWALSAYYFIPDIVLTTSSEINLGILLWPLGLWFSVLGLYYLFFDGNLKRFKNEEIIKKAMFVVWIVSLLAFSLTKIA